MWELWARRRAPWQGASLALSGDEECCGRCAVRWWSVEGLGSGMVPCVPGARGGVRLGCGCRSGQGGRCCVSVCVVLDDRAADAVGASGLLGALNCQLKRKSSWDSTKAAATRSGSGSWKRWWSSVWTSSTYRAVCAPRRREGDLTFLGTTWNECFHGLGLLDCVINITMKKTPSKPVVHCVMFKCWN